MQVQTCTLGPTQYHVNNTCYHHMKLISNCSIPPTVLMMMSGANQDQSVVTLVPSPSHPSIRCQSWCWGGGWQGCNEEGKDFSNRMHHFRMNPGKNHQPRILKIILKAFRLEMKNFRCNPGGGMSVFFVLVFYIPTNTTNIHNVGHISK